MPFVASAGARIFWRLDGLEAKPPLVLLNSIGTDLSLWDAVVPHLLPDFRLLRLDMRGHGASDTSGGDYTMALLAEDVAAVMDAAGVGAAVVAGVSLGGMVAMQLALDRPERISALALVCTSPAMDRGAWEDRIMRVRKDGMPGIADLAMGRFLSPAFAAHRPVVTENLRRNLIAMAAEGYAGAAAAIRDMELLDRLPELGVPTLVVTGDRDVSTPFAGHGERLVADIPGAVHVRLDCAHLAPIEAPAGLAAAFRDFLVPADDTRRAEQVLFEQGISNRRRVLGDVWVDRALAARTPFNAEFQAMITRTAWHEIWGRPGLDERTRRLLVVAITASLGRWEEFGLHVRAGLSREGFTRDELKEVLMQTAVYAGVPAANTGFAEAGRIIAELDAGA
ncbi:3-oxoadipate enol-lactonase/4-carboxymuconolactone decarboxylase [Ancylobacter sp. 3268]|uniref:bifunctional 3-oxoadipate enol-lactonase/4-carboxymuconolactone decarboxylase PcaDC n=1 Tax=Ancylobacter sp. 3268 TaxID=2817752 RepID=UPI0028665600|nr:3-oxoadipate enol-lactonase [Ancylobacter sp. 3268]MDR6954856.1 3-oxoadipate enol-lactonase/4-carboxymuconolactone decarboxylase [Ancylobacter sp. 3268]